MLYNVLEVITVIGERILLLRENLNLTQGEFAEKIGLKQAAIGLYENGKRNVTDRVIGDICREFNVTEDWLRYGAGEMFIVISDDIISEFEKKFKLGKVFRSALKSYIEADEFTRKTIDNFLMDVANGSIDLTEDEGNTK